MDELTKVEQLLDETDRVSAALEGANRELADAIAVARELGCSWEEIATAAGRSVDDVDGGVLV